MKNNHHPLKLALIALFVIPSINFSQNTIYANPSSGKFLENAYHTKNTIDESKQNKEKVFLSIKNSNAIVRNKASHLGHVKHVYKCKGYPVELISESGIWKVIKDINGNTGWIHISSISKKRYVLIYQDVNTARIENKKENTACTNRDDKSNAKSTNDQNAPHNTTVLAFRLPGEKSKPLFRIEDGTIGLLKKCKDDFCKIKFNQTRSGWVKKANLWGI